MRADLKRLVRHLRGNPRLIYEYHPQRCSKEIVTTRALELQRVGTEKNYSDICTKPMPEVAMLKHLKNMGFRFHAG